MRRRRSKMRALKKFHIQGQIFVYWMLVFSSYILCEPGYLDFDNLPETNFTCAGKVIGGYYADLETSCQMFHVCTIGQLDEPMDIKFLCLNGTVFDQETRVCERVEEVDCPNSEKFYDLNLQLYGNTMLPQHEEESSQETYSQPLRSTSAPQTTISTTTAKTVTKPASTIPSNTDDKLNKPNSYSQSRPSLAPPNGFNLSTTQKPFELADVDEEYEYEDDFYTTHGKDLSNYQSMFTDDESLEQNDQNDELVISDVKNTSTSSQKLTTIASTAKPMATIKTTSAGDHNDFSQNIFSPQQFILNQNHAKQTAQSLVKLEPISFQQQKFQNGGTLTVTNSHPSSTTEPSPSSDLSYLQSFRVQGQGFRLPSVHLVNNYEQQHILQQQQHELLQKQLTPMPQTFEGYRKQQKPQIALRLPIEENRSHFDSLDDIYSPEEQKELKQSEIHPQSRRTTHVITHSQDSNYGYKNNAAANSESRLNNTRNEDQKSTTYDAYQTQQQQQQQQQKQQSDYSHQNHRHYNEPNNPRISANRGESNTNYDKVLLTPQEQYIPTLPKVIITASASVTDASGKKLNYSVGNVISSTNAKLSTIYDEYREDDVSLDPFFLDVPKILPRRNKRNIVVS